MINPETIREKLPDLVLGKLSDFEHEVIHNFLIDNDELMQEYLDLCQILDTVVGLEEEPSLNTDQKKRILTEAIDADEIKPEEASSEEQVNHLTDGQRQKIIDFATTAQKTLNRPSQKKQKGKRSINWWRFTISASAACLMVSFLGAMLFPTFGKMQRSSEPYRKMDSKAEVYRSTTAKRQRAQFNRTRPEASASLGAVERVYLDEVKISETDGEEWKALAEPKTLTELNLKGGDKSSFEHKATYRSDGEFAIKSELQNSPILGSDMQIPDKEPLPAAEVSFSNDEDTQKQLELEDRLIEDPFNIEAARELKNLQKTRSARAYSKMRRSKEDRISEINWKWSEPVSIATSGSDIPTGGRLSDKEGVDKDRHVSNSGKKVIAKRKIKKPSVSKVKFDPRKMTSPSVMPESTFRLHVNTASYSLVQKALFNHRDYDERSVRAEEFINYFNYSYPQPAYGVFTISPQMLQSPEGKEKKVYLRVGLQARRIGIDNRRAMNTLILLDTSGSMALDNRLAMIKNALQEQLPKMRSQDKVYIITETSESAVLSKASNLQVFNNNTKAHGSTDLSLLLRRGLVRATQLYRSNPQDLQRLILISDGYADRDLKISQIIADKQLRSVQASLSVVGLGLGASERQDLRRLSEDSDGFFHLIKSREEMQRVFAEEMSATASVVAEDVKMQVYFNPETVKSYRLIGYEDRHIAAKDFRNDKINSGEVRSGQAATALYEIELKSSVEEGFWAEVRLRYRNIEDGKVEEINRRIRCGDKIMPFSAAEPSAGTAIVAGRYAEILRYGGTRTELQNLYKWAKALQRKQPQNKDMGNLLKMINLSMRR